MPAIAFDQPAGGDEYPLIRYPDPREAKHLRDLRGKIAWMFERKNSCFLVNLVFPLVTDERLLGNCAQRLHQARERERSPLITTTLDFPHGTPGGYEALFEFARTMAHYEVGFSCTFRNPTLAMRLGAFVALAVLAGKNHETVGQQCPGIPIVFGNDASRPLRDDIVSMQSLPYRGLALASSSEGEGSVRSVDGAHDALRLLGATRQSEKLILDLSGEKPEDLPGLLRTVFEQRRESNGSIVGITLAADPERMEDVETLLDLVAGHR